MIAAGRFLTVDGIRTHYTESGIGKTIILLHGLGGPLMWQRVVEPLSDKFHVVVLDLPGWGESDCPPRPYTAAMYADFVTHFFDAVGIEKVICAGISFGGQVGVHVAAYRPQRVDKLILICSTGLPAGNRLLRSSVFWSLFSFIIRYTVLRSEYLMCVLARRSFFDLRTRPQDLCRNFYTQISMNGKREAWLNGFRNVYVPDGDFERRLLEISSPTLIIWGENDRTISPGTAQEFQRRIRHSVISIFHTCAHSVPLEKPRELFSSILDFSQSTT